MHTSVKKAQQVISNRDAFPSIIVSYAEVILEYYDKKKRAISWLWNNRTIFHMWLKGRKGNNQMKGKRAATVALRECITSEQLKKFHKSYSYLADINMNMTYLMFDSMLKVLYFDVEQIHDYVVCVNMKKLDQLDKLNKTVQFLKWVDCKEMNEILAWRLMNSSKHDINVVQFSY